MCDKNLSLCFGVLLLSVGNLYLRTGIVVHLVSSSYYIGLDIGYLQ